MTQSAAAVDSVIYSWLSKHFKNTIVDCEMLNEYTIP